jgi:hypothetical protein
MIRPLYTLQIQNKEEGLWTWKLFSLEFSTGALL